jgi:predicted SprT family Zn-dependent metalloprotease
VSVARRQPRGIPEFDPIEELRDHYAKVVDTKFEGLIPRDYRIEFNPYLRRLTGRITYSLRLIEISFFHFQKYGMKDAIATLEHELLHLYLHKLGLPSGHGKQFKRMAAKKGIRVFHANPYPTNQPSRFRYLYECPRCRRMVSRKRAMKPHHRLACGICCRAHNSGGWDARFELRLLRRVQMV